MTAKLNQEKILKKYKIHKKYKKNNQIHNTHKNET